MPFDFAKAKATARRTVHATFGVQAFVTDHLTNETYETRARWHNRIAKPVGGLEDGDGFADVIEGIDHIALIPVDIQGFPLTLKRLDTIVFPSLHNTKFTLEYRQPSTGPEEEAWTVSRHLT